MPIQPVKTETSILGYTLKKRIGNGGYGEVWEAEAPGGLLKAIKLIYGFHDENRAQRELKALNRVKELRHPFLLSLERIEIADGRLAVITELADKSLSDRFRECIDQGLPGIPRDELLAYLEDAADALDFISASHSLQHLDIKPENLLLVGKHVKVADFGLIKDMRETTQSMMAGLTPTYAPPEVFDGHPGIYSDQYSLGIVYQEMLTGVRPFSGSTAAQLAAQHLNADPDVSVLPRGDQASIRRALSKDPSARFSTCGDLVSELLNREAKKARRVQKRLAPQPDVTKHTVQLSDSQLSNPISAISVEKLARLELDPQAMAIRPTLFIGIGQTATTVMRQLRRRLRQRLGERDAIPAVRILCIDTDARDLNAAVRRGELDSLSPDETLPIPLRRPEEYRDDSKMHLSWISRRWIYNIPRSLQTEGIRPLGRLAFADHHEAIFDRLHQLFDEMTLAESLARTAETVELDPSSAEGPRVFIVTSISGGVGSGIVLDMAYAVRTALLERGLSDDAVYGVLAFSSGRSASERDLTVANTLSCLSEMNHFSCASSFPGDETCNLPPFDEEDGETFSRTYLIDLGSNLHQAAFESATDEMAEYLYLSSVTRCAAFFDACREDTRPDNRMMVSSFGINHSVSFEADVTNVPACQLTQRLIDHWLKPATEENALLDGKQILDQAGVTLSLMLTRLERVIQQLLNKTPSSVVEECLKVEISKASQLLAENGGESLIDQVQARINDLFSRPEFKSKSPSVDMELRSSFVDIVASEQQNQISEFGNSVERIVLEALNIPGQRVHHARVLQQAIADRLAAAREEIVLLRGRADEGCHAICDQLAVAATSVDAADIETVDASAAVRKYGQLRMRQFVLESTAKVFAGLQDKLQRVAGLVGEFAGVLAHLSEDMDVRIHQHLASHSESKGDDLIERLIFKKTHGKLDRLCEVTEQLLQDSTFAEQGGLGNLLNKSSRWQGDFQSAVDQAARRVVANEMRNVNIDSLLADEGVSDGQVADWLQSGLETAMPNFVTKCGGETRLMAAVPQGSSAEAVRRCAEERLQEFPTVVNATSGDVALCYEIGRVPLANIATHLIQSRPDCTEYVSRLHTRIDVNWTPLIRLE